MDTDRLLADLVEWCGERYPGDPPQAGEVRLASGRVVPLPVPAVVPRPAAPPVVEDDAKQLDRDILDLIEERGKRMLRKEIAKALLQYGDSTVQKRLAALTRGPEALLDHDRDAYGYGYGLSSWGDS
jgi:hypothetical protein